MNDPELENETFFLSFNPLTSEFFFPFVLCSLTGSSVLRCSIYRTRSIKGLRLLLPPSIGEIAQTFVSENNWLVLPNVAISATFTDVEFTAFTTGDVVNDNWAGACKMMLNKEFIRAQITQGMGHPRVPHTCQLFKMPIGRFCIQLAYNFCRSK